MVSRRFYPIVPLFGSVVWCGGLVAMLITWGAQGRPHYVSQEESVPFISDIGADILKPLFITMCSITAGCFAFSLAAERWLRHTGRLLPNTTIFEKVFAAIAIFGATLGGVALILLSIFDTKRNHHLHRIFLLIFMLGVAISAIFTVLEFHWLKKQYVHSQQLRRSYVMKIVIASTLILLAIVFGATLDNRKNVAGVLEWVIAFLFTLYLLTFYLDLRTPRDINDQESQWCPWIHRLWSSRPSRY